MLVLSRHREESIMIGDDICITVVEIHGNKVRLGITAPRDVSVHRWELWATLKGLITAPVRKFVKGT
jgi:carbon storage regulator